MENSKDRKDLVKLIDEFIKKEDVFRCFVRFRGKEAVINDKEIFERFIKIIFVVSLKSLGKLIVKKHWQKFIKTQKQKTSHK